MCYVLVQIVQQRDCKIFQWEMRFPLFSISVGKYPYKYNCTYSICVWSAPLWWIPNVGACTRRPPGARRAGSPDRIRRCNTSVTVIVIYGRQCHRLSRDPVTWTAPPSRAAARQQTWFIAMANKAAYSTYNGKKIRPSRKKSFMKTANAAAVSMKDLRVAGIRSGEGTNRRRKRSKEDGRQKQSAVNNV